MCPKRHDELFEAIASFPALRAAAKRAIKGKRGKAMPAAFMAGDCQKFRAGAGFIVPR